MRLPEDRPLIRIHGKAYYPGMFRDLPHLGMFVVTLLAPALAVWLFGWWLVT